MSGLGAMVWKEARELVFAGGRPTWQFLGGVFSAVLFGLMPFLFGLGTGDPAVGFFGFGAAVFLPLIMVMGLTPEAFAGERERHTLETLLASPLRDRDILYGKMIVIMGYGVALAILSLTLFLATTGAMMGMATMAGLVVVTVLVLLLGLLLSAILLLTGVLISIRSATVKGASQAMVLAYLPLFLPLVVGGSAAPVILMRVPEDRWLFWGLTVGGGILLFILVTLGVLWWWVHRVFRRERLILVR